jgi:hypothetical protein
MDAALISALVISIGTAVVGLITALHIRKCKSICLEVDCRKEPATPVAQISNTSV